MNKRGQVLILFVFIIPLLVILAAIVIDNGVILKEKSKLNSTTRIIIKEVINKEIKDVNEVIKLFQENEIDVSNLVIEIKENEVIIKNNYKIDSLFGNVVGIKKYEIKTNIKGIRKDNKIRFE